MIKRAQLESYARFFVKIIYRRSALCPTRQALFRLHTLSKARFFSSYCFTKSNFPFSPHSSHLPSLWFTQPAKQNTAASAKRVQNNFFISKPPRYFCSCIISRPTPFVKKGLKNFLVFFYFFRHSTNTKQVP